MADDPINNANQTEKDNEVQETQKELLAQIKDSLVAQSESVGGSLGRDTINVRRHLLEMKKMNIEQIEHMKALNEGIGIQADLAEKKSETESVSKANEAEDNRDLREIFITISESLRTMPAALSKSSGAQAAESTGKFMSGMGSAFKGFGIGVGAAGIGAAAVIGAGAYLLNTIEDLDAQKTKDNVATLLSISDVVDGTGDSFLGESGKFFLAMSGLGLGLGVFALGSGLAAGVNMFTSGSDFAIGVKENVATLLSIADLPGMGLDAAGVALTLGGIGFGLALFALGKAGAGAAELGTAGIEYFTGGGNWAQNVKDEVLTLLSIMDGGAWSAVGDTAAFVAVMAGLMSGLLLWTVGSGVAGVGDALTRFTAGDNFAEDIKREVETLLSISQIEGIGWDTAKFAAVMGGLGAGLAAFGTGKGVAGTADAITQFSSGDNFAEDIKKEVATLLSIPDLPGATLEKTTQSMGVLAALGAGLTAFGAGTFVAGLGQAGAAVLNFFTGTKSPLEQALTLADKSEEIDKGVESLSNFKSVLDDFTSIGSVTFDMDTEQLSEDLLNASKTFELALEGGTDYRGFNKEYKGLINIEGIDEAVNNINAVKAALLQIPSTTGVEINANSLADQIAERLQAGGGGNIATSIASDNSSNMQSNVVVMNSIRNDTVDSLTRN